MVLDEGKGSCSEDVVVGTLYVPVEVGQAKLVIDYSTVGHTKGCPGWQFALVKMTCQNLRGSWKDTVIPKCTWEKHKLQKTAMDHSQNPNHYPSLHVHFLLMHNFQIFSLGQSLITQISQCIWS